MHAKAAPNATPEIVAQAEQFNNATQAWYYRLYPEFYNAINVSAADFLKTEDAAPETSIEPIN